MNKDLTRAESLLERIAAALEHRYGRASDGAFTLAGTDAFVWEADTGHLVPVTDVAALPLSLLKGIDAGARLLHENTRRFADGLPANNALLWGARGMGKSSLVKAVHAAVNKGRAKAEAARAYRDPARGHRLPAPSVAAAARASTGAVSCFATISPSTGTTPATNR